MHPARTLVESILPDDILVPVRAVKVRFNPRLGIGGYNVTINDVVACVALKPTYTCTHTHYLTISLSLWIHIGSRQHKLCLVCSPHASSKRQDFIGYYNSLGTPPKRESLVYVQMHVTTISHAYDHSLAHDPTTDDQNYPNGPHGPCFVRASCY